MNLAGTCVTTALLALVWVTPAAAQNPTTAPAGDEQTLQRVWVKLADSKKELSGRLLTLDKDVVSIEIKRNAGVERLDLPLARVARVRQKVPDSVIEGALLMGAYVAACQIWWCAQGLAEAPGAGHAILGVGVGAAIGAFLDSRIYRRKTIFAATGPGSSPKASVSLTLRF
jgi:hypothetical protein